MASFVTRTTLLLSAIACSTPTMTAAFCPTFHASKTTTGLGMTASSSSTDSVEVVHPTAVIPNPPPTKTAKGVIFDIDGTLADSWKLGYDATVVVLQNNNLGHVEINEDIYHATCVYPTPERLARTAGLTPETDKDTFESLGETLAQQFDDFYVQLVSAETAGFYDGIMDLLQNFPEETKVGALTNACVAYGHAVLEANCPVKSSSSSSSSSSSKGDDDSQKERYALYDRFGTIHGADSVPAAKPSPEGLFQCAQDLGLKPSECIYVGDAIGDGKAARAAGMVSIGVLWGSNSEEKLRNANVFDYICSTREELRELLPQQP